MTIRSNLADSVVTDRGGIVENRYNVHAAVVDIDGKIMYAVGDPCRITLARSAAKLVQALAIVETGGPGQFGFDDADIALMCASHSSEDQHVRRAQAMLAKVGAEEKHLRCGGHAALSDTVNRQWIRDNYEPTRICNNCSGKHAGMIAGAKALGADWTHYHQPDNAVQVQVRKTFEELTDLNANELKWGIDGCNLPAPACPLFVLAKTYAFFADAADTVCSTSSPRVQAAARIFNAMTQHPELVGGTNPNRFCTELARSFAGTVVGKLGADGCYGIGIRAAATEHNKPIAADENGRHAPVGIAVKIEDGNIDILYSAVTEILERLRIGSVSERQALVPFRRRYIKNTVGVVTGKVSYHFKIRRVEAKIEIDDNE